MNDYSRKINQLEELDLTKSVQELKSKIDSCQTEHNHIIKLASSLNSLKMDCSSIDTDVQCCSSGGDATDINRNKSSTTLSSHKLTHEEYLSKLIKNTSAENLKLRESNVKLKQESKTQDQQIRELNRRIKQRERNLQESQSQQALIYDLKDAVDKKNDEIRQLRQNVNDVKLLLKKEQIKTTCLQKKQRIISTPAKSDANREIKSKVETLLLQIDLLLKEQEQKRPVVCLTDRYYNKIQTLLNRLVFLKSKALQNNKPNSIETGGKAISSSKSDKSVQVSESTEDAKKCYWGKNESCLSIFTNVSDIDKKYTHRKHKSI